MEFALIAPLLILLVFGSIEFGGLFLARANLANAAREGAREMAITNNSVTAKSKVKEAAKPTSIKLSDVTIVPASCDPGEDVTVTVTVSYDTVTGMFGKTFPAKGRGVMRCGG